MPRDPHEVLGVRRGASQDELRAAWHTAVARHHPDHGGDPEAFLEAQEAYRVLTTPAPRPSFLEVLAEVAAEEAASFLTEYVTARRAKRRDL